MTASQLHCYPRGRAMKLQNMITEYSMILISILVLTSLYRIGVCNCKPLPLQPFGYISLDCGGEGGYNDTLTGLGWVSDEDYFESGDWLGRKNLTFSSEVVRNDSSPTSGFNAKQLETARIFKFLPNIRDTKYCYRFNISLSNEKSTSYLVRALIPPRKVSNRTGIPNSLSDMFWFSVDSTPLRVEPDDKPITIELLVSSFDDSLNICLLPLDFRILDITIAAISSLEVRSIPEILYPVFDHGKLDQSGRPIQRTLNYYLTMSRLNFGGDESSPPLRYPFDRYDRLWYSAPQSYLPGAKYMPVSTKTDQKSDFKAISIDYSTISNGSSENDSFQVPPAVLASAWEGVNLNSTISFSVDLDTLQPGVYDLLRDTSDATFCLRCFCVSIVLFDIDADMNRSRSVNIFNKDVQIDEFKASEWILQDVEVPKNETYIWADRTFRFYGNESTFEIAPAASSKLPAMINALEIYLVLEGIPPKTRDDRTVQSLLNSLRFPGQIDSFGDPCFPVPWFWLKCDDRFAEVLEINLSSQGLQGNLTLTDSVDIWLTVLDLSNNRFHGNLPSAIGTQFPYLLKLDLSDNKFTGSVPDFPNWDLVPLEFLNLSSNNMSGYLTRFSANLSRLQILDLSRNNFVGPIPAFPNGTLQVLNLSSNHLSGGIFDMLHFNDSGLFRIQPLRALRLDSNRFSGMIPDEIWSSESRLETVGLSNNNFTELNLTSWVRSLLKNDSFSGVQQLNLANNPIRRVVLGAPDRDAISDLESRKDEDMHRLLKRTPGYILLGEKNEWCNSSALSRARVFKKYLCRDNEADDYYYWTLLQGTDASSKRTLIISLGVSGSVVLLMACILLFFLGRMWRRMKDLRQIQEELAKEDVRPPFYKYEELRAATKDFSEEYELGKGGFGAVYKAQLVDTSIVAVKLLYPMEQNLTDFLKETVLITGIKHRHLVQLKGCCVRDKKRMLVYEYAENGNLAQALWDNDGSSFLNWTQRLKICIGVAKGLSYLHEELQPKIIHRDIKPYNILLDKDWNAKIADFGLARHLEGDAGTQTTSIGGTVGYRSPEYSIEGLITEKLDVYSYGILLLEIVSGRKCIDHSAPADQFYLRNWAFSLYREGCLFRMAEKRLLGLVSAEEIEFVLKIALSCVQQSYENRPSMNEVIIMLTGNASGVAINIIDELRSQQQALYDNLSETFNEGQVSGVEEREDAVLLELTSMSNSNSTAFGLDLSDSGR